MLVKLLERKSTIQIMIKDLNTYLTTILSIQCTVINVAGYYQFGKTS